MDIKKQYQQVEVSCQEIIMDMIRECTDADYALPTIEGLPAINAVAVMALGQVALGKPIKEAVKYAVNAYAKGGM